MKQCSNWGRRSFLLNFEARCFITVWLEAIKPNCRVTFTLSAWMSQGAREDSLKEEIWLRKISEKWLKSVLRKNLKVFKGEISLKNFFWIHLAFYFSEVNYSLHLLKFFLWGNWSICMASVLYLYLLQYCTKIYYFEYFQLVLIHPYSGCYTTACMFNCSYMWHF